MPPDKTALSAPFATFATSAFRLETLQTYAVPQEDAAWKAFTQGRPLPRRTPANNPWMRRLTEYTAAGRRVYRAHIVDWPLSRYLRFELLGYQENMQAGEEVFITPRDSHPDFGPMATDWWLFDDTHLMLMHYDHDGVYLGAEPAPPRTDLNLYRRQRDLALQHGLSLEDYLSSHKEYRSA